MRTLKQLLCVAALGTCAGAVQAGPVGYNIAWSGSNGYSMTGMFAYHDSGERFVTGHDLTQFMIEGWRSGSSLGSWSGTPELFVFDSGRQRISALLQAWNVGGNDLSFGCALTVCAMGVDGNLIKRSAKAFSHIAVTPREMAALSEPLPIVAVLAGLGALFFGLRRRSATALPVATA